MNKPTQTTCPHCGTVAAEIVCHLCSTPRPWWERLRLHPAMTHAQADETLRDLGLKARNDGRGDIMLVPR